MLQHSSPGSLHSGSRGLTPACGPPLHVLPSLFPVWLFSLSCPVKAKGGKKKENDSTDPQAWCHFRTIFPLKEQPARRGSRASANACELICFHNYCWLTTTDCSSDRPVLLDWPISKNLLKSMLLSNYQWHCFRAVRRSAGSLLLVTHSGIK